MTTQVSPDLISPSVSPLRNAVMNGNFEIWQRGTSFATLGATDSIWTADRWIYRCGGAHRVTVTKDTSVPTLAQCGIIAAASWKAAVTTANASLSAGDYCLLWHKIEGYTWRKYWQRPLVLSFWVRSTVTGNFSASALNGINDRSCFLTFTVNVANTWEYKTLVFPASPSTGTWNLTTTTGLLIGFNMAVGSTYNTGTPGAWNSGGAFAGPGQANAVSSTSNVFQFALVQLEVGTAPSEFEDVPYDMSLVRCNRFYPTDLAT